MSEKIDRRKMLGLSAGAVAASTCLTAGTSAATASTGLRLQPETREFKSTPQAIRYCLNTSTVRGQKLTVPQQIDLATKTGYDAIELWVPELREYLKTGKLADLRKRITDAGITVESAIGFAKWIVDDDQERKKGLDQARQDMELLREIGGKRIAAPPIGAHKQSGPKLPEIAKRYHALLELGKKTEVTPQLELWGFSKTLSRLGELAFVAAECGHEDACVLPDVYHIYKGGSDFNGLQMLEGSRIHVFHMNDYPATPKRKEIGDADRVYPGDGIAPLKEIIQGLVDNGFAGFFSIELFNREYWKLDAAVVARTGLRKMKDAVASLTESK